MTPEQLRAAVQAYGGIREYARVAGVPYSTLYGNLHGVTPSATTQQQYAATLPSSAGMAGWHALEAGTPEGAAFVARNLPPNARVMVRAYGRTYPSDPMPRWKTYFGASRPGTFGRQVSRYVRSYDRAMDLRWQVVWTVD